MALLCSMLPMLALSVVELVETSVQD